MDIKVSQKEQMMQPNGMVDVITSGINDFFLLERTDDQGQKWITDIEGIDDFLEEEKDRVIFSVLRQRGQDPISIGEGIQWVESMMAEIPVPLLMQQIMDAATRESQYVNVSFETIMVNGQEQLSIRFNTIGVNKYIKELQNAGNII
jgi:hypothetical protein